MYQVVLLFYCTVTTTLTKSRVSACAKFPTIARLTLLHFLQTPRWFRGEYKSFSVFQSPVFRVESSGTFSAHIAGTALIIFVSQLG